MTKMYPHWQFMQIKIRSFYTWFTFTNKHSFISNVPRPMVQHLIISLQRWKLYKINIYAHIFQLQSSKLNVFCSKMKLDGLLRSWTTRKNCWTWTPAPKTSDGCATVIFPLLFNGRKYCRDWSLKFLLKITLCYSNNVLKKTFDLNVQWTKKYSLFFQRYYQ